jgi:phosphatidylinositol kinase/protein kinase (PI-3  family)
VAVLPSKTKPKKIIMRGSNGSKYTYLLKGREDLHLDERIMQFLTIVNQTLDRSSEAASKSLRARNYGIISLYFM